MNIPFATVVPTLNAKTKTAMMALKNAKALLGGRVLVIDPSIGSKPTNYSEGSKPGWAIFEAGVLQDYGVIDLDWKGSKQQRARRLLLSLQNDFPGRWDMLVIEDIPPIIGRGRGAAAGFHGSLSLHWAVGISLAAVDAAGYMKVAIQSWRAWVPESYQKSDDHDAVAIGVAALGLARLMQERKGRLADKKKVARERAKAKALKPKRARFPKKPTPE